MGCTKSQTFISVLCITLISLPIAILQGRGSEGEVAVLGAGAHSVLPAWVDRTYHVTLRAPVHLHTGEFESGGLLGSFSPWPPFIV